MHRAYKTSQRTSFCFSQAIAALGDRGEGLTTEVWWSPFHPFSSGLSKHMLFEVGIIENAQVKDCPVNREMNLLG
jgi:hypothetical protein